MCFPDSHAVFLVTFAGFALGLAGLDGHDIGFAAVLARLLLDVVRFGINRHTFVAVAVRGGTMGRSRNATHKSHYDDEKREAEGY